MTNNLVGTIGDIFWDLPTWVQYLAGSELGCIIYVANPTDEAKEYSLMSVIVSNGETLLEEAITVHDLTWFEVDPNDFIRLFGALSFNFTNVTLIVQLIEKESNEVVNEVSTYLSATQWPPGWPGGAVGGFDWTSLLMLIMLVVMGIVMVKSVTKEEKKEPISYEERKTLPI